MLIVCTFVVLDELLDRGLGLIQDLQPVSLLLLQAVQGLVILLGLLLGNVFGRLDGRCARLRRRTWGPFGPATAGQCGHVLYHPADGGSMATLDEVGIGGAGVEVSNVEALIIPLGHRSLKTLIHSLDVLILRLGFALCRCHPLTTVARNIFADDIILHRTIQAQRTGLRTQLVTLDVFVSLETLPISMGFVPRQDPIHTFHYMLCTEYDMTCIKVEDKLP